MITTAGSNQGDNHDCIQTFLKNLFTNKRSKIDTTIRRLDDYLNYVNHEEFLSISNLAFYIRNKLETHEKRYSDEKINSKLVMQFLFGGVIRFHEVPIEYSIHIKSKDQKQVKNVLILCYDSDYDENSPEILDNYQMLKKIDETGQLIDLPFKTKLSIIKNIDQPPNKKSTDISIYHEKDLIIGKIDQNSESNTKFTEDTYLMTGYIQSEVIEKYNITPGTFVILQNLNSRTFVGKIKKRSQSIRTISLPYKSASDLVITVIIELQNEIIGNELQECHLINFENFNICKVNKNIINLVYDLKNEGLSLGILKEYKDEELTYNWPMFYDEFGFKGVLITGTPGSGKTNFLKLMACKLSQLKNNSLIILDFEGQFKTLTKSIQGNDELENLWNKLGLHAVNNIDYYAINNEVDSDKIPLSVINPHLLQYLLPALEEKSAAKFIEIANEIFKDEIESYEDFERKFQTFVLNYPNMNSSIKTALLRALSTGPSKLFNKNGNEIDIKRMIQPGKVTVINYHELNKDDKRILVLFILLTVKELKKDDSQSVFFMIDEAHQLFPKSKKGEQYKNYIERIENKISEYLHTGRKRQLGMIFATQLLDDISRQFVDICANKFFFQQETNLMLKNILGKEYSSTVTNLGKGEAIVYIPGVHRRNKFTIKTPIAPVVHENKR